MTGSRACRVPLSLLVVLVTLAGCAGEPSRPDAARQVGPAPQLPVAVAVHDAGPDDGSYRARPTGSGRLEATNRAQGIAAEFSATGVTLRPVSPGAGTGGVVSLSLVAFGSGDARMDAPAVAAAQGACQGGGADDDGGACPRRVEYARPGLLEWWENRPAGLEQGFEWEAPAGNGPLVLDLRASGGRFQVEAGGNSASLLADGGARWSYSGLRAWDETDRDLPARMEAAPGGLRLVVDTRGAVGRVTVDPLLTSPAWTAESDSTNGYMGSSVASAGDVNGDGYSDLVVGAPILGNGQASEGRAYVHHGSASGLIPSPAWTAESNQANANFGNSVASAGDVNGDGYSDVIVGVVAYDNVYTDTGRAVVYLGSASGLAASPTWAAEVNQAYAYFGSSVASAGDVNGDGYSDVVVGSRAYTNGQNYEGRAFLYLGSASGLATSPAWTAESNLANADFGYQVASAGDVNGDGYADVVVGAPSYDNGQNDEGRAYLYLGSATGLGASPAWTAESDQASAQLGWSVAGTGDVNGDGYSDVMVGALGYDHGQTNEGGAWLYLGSASGLGASPAWIGESNQVSGWFGASVAGAGDVNGDGYADVVIGATGYDNGQTDEGRASLFFGSATGLSASAGWTGESEQASASFGISVASAGDVDGDGYGDVAVGSPHYDNGNSQEGRAWAYRGSPAGPSSTSAWNAEPDQASASLGAATASAGDVNGDGYGDTLVGVPDWDGGQADEGRAQLHLGNGTGVEAAPSWTVEADQAGAGLGTSVAWAGDADGDGYADVLVGAPGYGNGQSGEGRAYLYRGSAAGLAVTPVWNAEPDQAGAGFGSAVATAGDVDCNGYSDALVGAPEWDGGEADEGKVYLYRGSAAGLEAEPSWTVESDQAGARLGAAVAAAGDVDDDGCADLLVAAPGYDGGQTDEGRVYLYLGSGAGPGTSPAWTAESDQASAAFGTAIAAAGDVNRDGYGDVLVGAPAYDDGQTDEGRAYLYLGSAAGLTASPAWTAEPDQASALFGSSVGSSGDVNGDGYGDVAVGAPGYDNGQTDEGRVSLYLGSASGPGAAASWTSEPDQAAAGLGASVSAAGDANGDGFGDLLAGAPGWDNGQTDEGRAVLYLGNSGDGAGAGVPARSQARRVGAATPIVPGLTSPDSGAFDVARISTRGHWGRAKVRLDVEVKPLGTAFDGTGLLTQESPADTGLAGVGVQQPVTGLDVGAGYHWRTRVRITSAAGASQGWGPWTYGGISGDSHGGHVFTGFDVPGANRDDRDGDGDAGDTDCDDLNPVMNHLDADGDGDTSCGGDCDDHDETLDLADGDGDGHSTCGGDCDDLYAQVHPGVAELCNGLDDDCDAVADEGFDPDGDGYACGAAWDCDGSDPAVNPGATEVCDGTDNDCDAVADEGLDVDLDADGHGSCTSDCDDGDAGVHPEATETCDGADQDCDGEVDEGFDTDADGYTTCEGDCDDAEGWTRPGARETCDGADNDCNGLIPRGETDFDHDGQPPCGGDCDDRDTATYEGAAELCDGIDNDCDDAVPVGEVDGDGDGYAACEDCDDAEPLAWTGSDEVCDDGVDNDCDGTLNDCPLSGDVSVSAAQAVFVGEDPSDSAGYAVAAGDVDGDGFSDLVVGASGDDTAAVNAGAVYVFYGPVMGVIDASVADAKLLGVVASDQAGWSVAVVPDIDGDGDWEIVAGAPQNDAGGANAGAAYLVQGPVYGSVSLSTASVTWVGEDAGDRAGAQVASAGDTSGDGVAEVLVGASMDDDRGSNAGAMYVLDPLATGTVDLSSAVAKLRGLDSSDQAGYGVAPAGDVNGDGVADVLGGAPMDELGGTNAGAAYLARGPFSGLVDLSAATLKMSGEAAGDQAGRVLAGGGDLSGDGVPDLVVTAWKHDAGGGDAGAVYLLRGNRSGSVGLSTANAKLSGEAGDSAGASAAVVGDVDADGFVDLLVGAPGSDAAGADAGLAYLVYGPISGTLSLDAASGARILGAAAGDQLGYGDGGLGAAAAGDVDGDGCADLLVGARFSDLGGSNSGAAWLLHAPCW